MLNYLFYSTSFDSFVSNTNVNARTCAPFTAIIKRGKNKNERKTLTRSFQNQYRICCGTWMGDYDARQLAYASRFLNLARYSSLDLLMFVALCGIKANFYANRWFGREEREWKEIEEKFYSFVDVLNKGKTEEWIRNTFN